MAIGRKKFHFNFLTDLLGEEKDRPLSWKNSHTGKSKTSYSYAKSYISHGGRKGGYTTSFSKSSKQQCVFKSSHRYDKTLNAKHLAYIQREGKGRNNSDPELYGADPEGYEKRMSKLHFRFIISPENQNVNLTELTREFIKRLEFRTGHRLDWVATEHYNTGKQHAHVLINGFDLNRNRVQFNRMEISRFMRENLQDICTEQVGFRTQQEKDEALQRQTESNSFTMIDRSLDNILQKYGKLTSPIIKKSRQPTVFHKRLMHLRDLGLVRYNTQTEEFIINPEWQENLKMYGRYNTFLDGLAFTRAHPTHYSLHNIDNLGPVSGKVVKRYYMQENSNNHAVVLETKPDYYVYVPLFEAPTQAPVGGNIKIEFQRMQTPSGGSKKIMTITNQS